MHKEPKTPGSRTRGVHGRVVQLIGEAIVQGRHAQGAILPRESDLVAKFGASRTSVREAIRVLAAKGLVETRRKIGSRIRPQAQWNHFDPDITAWRLSSGHDEIFIRDLLELRQINEPAAARLAAIRATLDDMASIEAALCAMDAAANQVDAVSYAKADVAFHMTIFAASHNNLMASLSSTIRQSLEKAFELYHAAKGPAAYSLQEDVAFHRAVLQYICRGEPERAAEAMSNVIAAAKRDLAYAYQLSRTDDARRRQTSTGATRGKRLHGGAMRLADLDV